MNSQSQWLLRGSSDSQDSLLEHHCHSELDGAIDPSQTLIGNIATRIAGLLATAKLEAGTRLAQLSLRHTPSDQLAEKGQQSNLFPSIRAACKSKTTRYCLQDRLPRILQPVGLHACKSTHSTAYLDAVRGYAAVIVVHTHIYGAGGPFFKIPFISLFRKGVLMVDIFFVISGFVLTRKTLSLARQTKHPELLQCLSSATFRRYLRLFLSSYLAAFAMMLSFYWRLLVKTVPMKDSFIGQLCHFAGDMIQFSNPFVAIRGYPGPGVHHPVYHPFLWTIPVEFRGSVLVFCFCLACYRTSPLRRAWICWFLILLCMMWTANWAALFLLGVFFADRSVAREGQAGETLPLDGCGGKKVRQSSRSTIVVSGVALLLGWFLAGQPPDLGVNGPNPWPVMSRMIPFWWPQLDQLREHFWLFVSAGLLMFGLEHCSLYQRPFEWAFSQYIGQLSFGIYVCHLPLLWNHKLSQFFTFLKASMGDNAFYRVVEYAIFMFLVICYADYFTRVDRRVIAFGRWIEQKAAPADRQF